MSLNIESEHIHDLVRQTVTRTGLDQTHMVERAVVELLASLEAKAAASGFDQLLGRVCAEPTASGGAPDFDALYGPETGLPQRLSTRPRLPPSC